MSVHDELGINLSIGHEQQSFRLLELPPPLLELVTSSTPPILYLKSEPTRSKSPSDIAPNAYVCTHDRTFEVRQVQSSNLLYVVQSTANVASTEQEGTFIPGIIAIGHCKALLELVPLPTAATKFLKQVLPVFTHTNVAIGDHKPKDDLMADAPFSAGELEAAWIELCGVELDLWGLGHSAWRPSAPSLMDHWKCFMGTVTVLGLDPTALCPINDVVKIMEEEGYLRIVLEAILRRLSSEFETGRALLDQEKCVPWVGTVLLEASSQETSIASSIFVTRWQDQLPERWRTCVSLNLLPGLFSDLGDGQIQSKAEKPPTNQQDAPPPPVADAKGTSKWHARLKSNR